MTTILPTEVHRPRASNNAGIQALLSPPALFPPPSRFSAPAQHQTHLEHPRAIAVDLLPQRAKLATRKATHASTAQQRHGVAG
jgi:hypothetical protein